jgi:hypothetical protein
MKYFITFITIIFSLILFDLAYPQTITTNVCEAPADECKWEFTKGDKITLEAEPESDSYFAGWAGDKCMGTNPICSFTMPNTDLFEYAIFELLPMENLYVYVFGKEGGRVTSVPAGINCTMGMCEAKFKRGIKVVLTATAPNGFTWRGLYCSGAGTCTTTMTKARVLNVRIK